MLRKLIPALLFVLMSTVSAGAFWSSGGYNYMAAEEVQKRLSNGPAMILVDICPADQFSKGHIAGSIETNAFPVETEEQRTRLGEVVPQIQASTDDVVIVCPRGGGGAKRTYDFYKSQGVAEERLFILEKGLEKWPYETQSR